MIPKYLYHYTSIDALKSILTTNSIRFKRLDLLNDPYEGIYKFNKIEDIEPTFRKLVYCSCWTALSDESVNLWALYTDLRGIRIKLKSNMFSPDMVLREQANGFIPYCTIPPLRFDSNLPSQPTEGVYIKEVNGPFKIEYVNKPAETYANITEIDHDDQDSPKELVMYGLYLREMGMKKIKHWDYENEWRYKICPLREIHASGHVFSEITSNYLETPEFIDIPLATQIEEITFAPKVESDKKEDLITFLQDRNLDILTKSSQIRINITNH